jgi:diguanylate cyclase (GGDEF)-like protein
MNIDPKINKKGEVFGYAATSQNVSDKKRIEGLSITDSLTQLYNRLKLDKAIIYEVDRSSRYHNPLSIVLFDVDDFKSVNDAYGHQIGDTVLVGIADIIHNIVRDADIAGRWGGEEFMIICPDTDGEGAAKLAEKLRKALADHKFKKVGKKSCSFGVATLRNKEDAQSLINRADDAMYQAKNEGRNRVVISS